LDLVERLEARLAKLVVCLDLRLESLIANGDLLATLIAVNYVLPTDIVLSQLIPKG
jgi:hypothetical protein